MKRSAAQWAGHVIGTAVLVVIGILLAPVAAAAWLWKRAAGLWIAVRLRANWPTQRFVLVAYTQSPLWAPYIEQSLLPRLGDAAVPVDRSKEAWKRDHPLEARALAFWGGARSFNPIVVVILRPWRVRVFRLFDAFQQLKHGQPRELEALVSELVQQVEEGK